MNSQVKSQVKSLSLIDTLHYTTKAFCKNKLNFHERLAAFCSKVLTFEFIVAKSYSINHFVDRLYCQNTIIKSSLCSIKDVKNHERVIKMPKT